LKETTKKLLKETTMKVVERDNDKGETVVERDNSSRGVSLKASVSRARRIRVL